MKLSEKEIFTGAVVPEGSYVPVSIATVDGPRIMQVAPDKIGAQGPAGSGGTGPTGPTGPAGEAGPAGANGTNGTNGTNGADGATGPAWEPTLSVLTYGATVTPDFTGDDYKTLALTGNVDFTASSNRAAGRSVVIFVLADGTPRTLAFNASWKFLCVEPTTIAANKEGVLSLSCKGSAETDVRAAWSVEP